MRLFTYIHVFNAAILNPVPREHVYLAVKVTRELFLVFALHFVLIFSSSSKKVSYEVVIRVGGK